MLSRWMSGGHNIYEVRINVSKLTARYSVLDYGIRRIQHSRWSATIGGHNFAPTCEATTPNFVNVDATRLPCGAVQSGEKLMRLLARGLQKNRDTTRDFWWACR